MGKNKNNGVKSILFKSKNCYCNCVKRHKAGADNIYLIEGTYINCWTESSDIIYNKCLNSLKKKNVPGLLKEMKKNPNNIIWTKIINDEF